MGQEKSFWKGEHYFKQIYSRIEWVNRVKLFQDICGFREYNDRTREGIMTNRLLN